MIYKSCPFCGSDSIRFARVEFGDSYITCRMCSARGPRISDLHKSAEAKKKLAVEKWNTLKERK